MSSLADTPASTVHFPTEIWTQIIPHLPYHYSWGTLRQVSTTLRAEVEYHFKRAFLKSLDYDFLVPLLFGRPPSSLEFQKFATCKFDSIDWKDDSRALFSVTFAGWLFHEPKDEAEFRKLNAGVAYGFAQSLVWMLMVGLKRMDRDYVQSCLARGKPMPLPRLYSLDERPDRPVRDKNLTWNVEIDWRVLFSSFFYKEFLWPEVRDVLAGPKHERVGSIDDTMRLPLKRWHELPLDIQWQGEKEFEFGKADPSDHFVVIYAADDLPKERPESWVLPPVWALQRGKAIEYRPLKRASIGFEIPEGEDGWAL